FTRLLSPIRLSLFSTLFPYTPLFRSQFFPTTGDFLRCASCGFWVQISKHSSHAPHLFRCGGYGSDTRDWGDQPLMLDLRMRRKRSEEHTSELQSRENLVCRLLLEKKK